MADNDLELLNRISQGGNLSKSDVTSNTSSNTSSNNSTHYLTEGYNATAVELSTYTKNKK